MLSIWGRSLHNQSNNEFTGKILEGTTIGFDLALIITNKNKNKNKELTIIEYIFCFFIGRANRINKKGVKYKATRDKE